MFATLSYLESSGKNDCEKKDELLVRGEKFTLTVGKKKVRLI